MMTTKWSVFPSFDRLLDEAMRPATARFDTASAFPIAVDVRESSDAYTFELDVPGVKSDDLEITLANNVLTVKGGRAFESQPNENVRRGRPHGQFAASYSLPDGIEGEALTADLSDGVLSIRVPKQPKAQPRKIPIATANEQKRLGA